MAHLATTVSRRDPATGHIINGIPKRELCANDSIALTAGTWSPWTLFITPVKVATWYAGPNRRTTASIRSIPLATLRTGVVGVYEIAVRPPLVNTTRLCCIYAGRARAEDKNSNHLRTRLSRYAAGGSDLHEELNYFLNLGCTVWVRWSVQADMQASIAQELALLHARDYACNTHNNGPPRPLKQVLWLIEATGQRTSLVAYIKELRDAEPEVVPVDQLATLLAQLSVGERNSIARKILARTAVAES